METVDPNQSESRNWAELPSDIITSIFEKLGQFEVLLNAQYVCAPWRRVSKEPQLWRIIDMRNPWNYWEVYDLNGMAREAISRCNDGQLIEFSIEYFPSCDILDFALDRSGHLRCLRLVSCYYVTDMTLVEIAKRNPLLEELDITFHSFSDETLESVFKKCHHLKSLHLNTRGYKRPHIECDTYANSIAQNMPELCRLQLFGDKLTDSGLEAILDGCPNLEYLDLRQCFSLKFNGGLLKKCTDRIKDLRLPNDSTDDYGFNAEIDGDASFEEDHPPGFPAMDFLFNNGDWLDYLEYDDFCNPFDYLTEDEWDFVRWHI